MSHPGRSVRMWKQISASDPVAEIHRSLAELSAEDRAGWSAEAQSARVRELAEVVERFQAELARAVAAWDASRAWEADGALERPIVAHAPHGDGTGGGLRARAHRTSRSLPRAHPEGPRRARRVLRARRAPGAGRAPPRRPLRRARRRAGRRGGGTLPRRPRSSGAPLARARRRGAGAEGIRRAPRTASPAPFADLRWRGAHRGVARRRRGRDRRRGARRTRPTGRGRQRARAADRRAATRRRAGRDLRTKSRKRRMRRAADVAAAEARHRLRHARRSARPTRSVAVRCRRRRPGAPRRGRAALVRLDGRSDRDARQVRGHRCRTANEGGAARAAASNRRA